MLMSDFKLFAHAVAQQFARMTAQGTLFRSLADPNQLWEHYLNSFPAGTNPLFRERTEHDCSCCKGFVRRAGGIVTIVDGQLVTLWDLTATLPKPYVDVTTAMADFVRQHSIDNIFLSPEQQLGASKNLELLPDHSTLTWHHFHLSLPTGRGGVVRAKTDIGPAEANARATYDVFLRSLIEITPEAVDTVLDLIRQNTLYRGEDHKATLEAFQKLKVQFITRSSGSHAMTTPELFAWQMSQQKASSAAWNAVLRIRNTALGTLLTDLSTGVDLETAVASFERIMAPTNYKRPKALVTKAMIEKAQETLRDLGLLPALSRRYATIEDISVNDILYVDRRTRSHLRGAATAAEDTFAALTRTIPERSLPALDRVDEIPVDKFLRDILPQATSLSVLFENRHAANLVSLIAPEDPTAPLLFKWPNAFSWSYTGELTDSIKERVKAAGGQVTGDFRASLSWFNGDDLDLHLVEPTGRRIYFREKRSPSGGELDVDMNAGHVMSRTPVENIFYLNRKQMPEGNYLLQVNQYNRRETTDHGFELELEFCGTVYKFAYEKPLTTDETVAAVWFNYTHAGGLRIDTTKSLPSSQTSKTVWNLPTQTWQPVSVVMLSPNCWGGYNRQYDGDDAQFTVGNRHFFFMLHDCLNDSEARGFFNEFLSNDLTPHRKVMELVGAKMKTERAGQQLSGLGFSATQRNSLLVKVEGGFSRVVKVVF